MAFSFANVAAGLSDDSTGTKVQDGPELQEIQTDQLGFSAVNGEAKVRLLPGPWPADDLPVPSASLLAAASSLGLVAAGGPEGLVIATTENIRKALKEKAGDKIRDIEVVLRKSHSRLAHVAFSADEMVLIVSEQSGGLVVYKSDQLKNGQAEPALSVATNSSGLRTMVPNPSVQWAQFIACVTVGGELMLADLGTGRLVEGADGPVLAKNVSCVSWSNKGKQLLAGLGDGSAIQMKQDGSIQARIPKSTSVADGSHLSAISWLETHSFFFVYTPNSTSLDEGIPPSEYYIVNRSGTEFTFQKLPEILSPFGMERVPSHHFISRLRDWKPHLNDLIILSATTASDVGILSKADAAFSKVDAVTGAFTLTTPDDDTRRATLPLSNGADTSPIGMAIDLSATTGIVNPIPSDPEIEESQGPVPNLLVLNQEGILCSWWIVYNDSIRQQTTFSGFSTLSTMEEARSAVSPPAQNSYAEVESSTEPTKDPENPTSESKPAFSQAPASTTSPFAKPTTAFGVGQGQSGFGTGAGFGSTSSIGDNKSSWASTGFSNTRDSGTSSAFGAPAFGKTGFGSTSALGSSGATSAFGTTGTLGNRPAAFGQASFGSSPASGSIFGTASNSTTSPFASATGTTGSSGFASFASKGGFSGLGSDQKEGNKVTPFGQPQQGGSIFGQNTSSQSPFGSVSGNSVFSKPTNESSFTKTTPFGTTTSTSTSNALSGSSFKLNSSFKSDGTAKDDLPRTSGGFGFGSGFGNLLNESKTDAQVSPTHDKEEDMDEVNSDHEAITSDLERSESFTALGQSSVEAPKTVEIPKSLVTPPSTLSQSKAMPAPPLAALFGTGAQPLKTPEPYVSTGFSFGSMPSTTPKDTPAPSNNLFGKSITQSSTTQGQNSEPAPITSSSERPPSSPLTPPGHTPKEDDAPKITTESPSDDDTVNIKKIPEAPLPPDPLSRPGFQTGDTSVSSINSNKPDDAPLPPDFLLANKSAITKAEETELPQDDENDGDEGEDSDFSHFEDSGEDITQDVSPAEDGEEDEGDVTTEHVQTSPESSFRGENTTTSIASPTGGLFTKVSASQQTKPSRPLFGEIGSSGPIFPPPKPQESPRSPSPVRQLLPHDTLRPDSRSVSAPVRPRSAIDQRKLDYTQSAIAAKAAQARDDEAAREKARLESLKQAQERAKAKELELLEDDEDERIQTELAEPIRPTETLDHFITYESTTSTVPTKADIPAQIERLYQDINSMVYTLGINARSISSYLAYQQGQKDNEAWPSVLQSETPLDALNDELFFQDIDRLHEGFAVLEQSLGDSSVEDVTRKLDQCQELLTSEVLELKTKVTALRKSIYVRIHGNSAAAPLSAEQASIQQDLRKAATGVQTKLASVEDSLTVLRARISDMSSSEGINGRPTASMMPKKPTVEAVTNTVTKMTSMAEKRSADLLVLEAQLRRLGLTGKDTPDPSTPPSRTKSSRSETPESATSSVYHTPESNVGGSARSIRFSARKSRVTSMVSVEDKERWLAKSKRKQEVAAALRAVLSSA